MTGKGLRWAAYAIAVAAVAFAGLWLLSGAGSGLWTAGDQG